MKHFLESILYESLMAFSCKDGSIGTIPAIPEQARGHRLPRQIYELGKKLRERKDEPCGRLWAVREVKRASKEIVGAVQCIMYFKSILTKY